MPARLPGLARAKVRPSHLRLVGADERPQRPDTDPPPPAPAAGVVRLPAPPAPARALLEACGDERRAA